MGLVMKLWLPSTERKLGRISAVPYDNHPLSHWQSLIIQYEEDRSLFPTIRSFAFPLLHASFLLPLSVLCNSRMLPLFPFHSPPVSLSRSLKFGSRVDSNTCVMKAKLIPLFQRNSHTWQLALSKKTVQNDFCEKRLCVWNSVIRGSGQSNLIASMASWYLLFIVATSATAWRIFKKERKKKKHGKKPTAWAHKIVRSCKVLNE